MGLLDKLNTGENVYGTCITSTGPMWPAAVKRAGLDFVFLDTEHVPLGRNELAALCQHFKALEVTPIVRIPSPDPYLACQAIDAGALGIVAPYLEARTQILDLVGATKYRPLKGEVLYKYLNGEEAMPEDLWQYVQKYNTNHICIANIESVPAMQKLDELLSIPGLDAVFIGPHDLSVSMGLPEQYDHPEFEAAVTQIIKTTRSKGLSIGIHFSLEPERQIRWIKEGANIIVHSFDVALFSQKLQKDLAIIREATGDFSYTDNSAIVI
ncbi:2-dehydro-3,6-dideoxy-6-sulfogluconate aldolase [Dyadobacter sp. CECT 9275]|uniref:2-dehydro-3,6-dideoxy-6-sulfogluconate aldolase n=1 Tax=Dyadobacter helix TaxID=2822344 RepID=A0A916J7X0_9BACT|nr:aldolase/citrate lyase family protein [Dyadobacter sp. CECT 9275]CAG4988945.1 2-dehydro-3,6-dideoxy-6-sulfogluconate aldolase [Dyadobacter sp. CECT 9275]